MAFFDAELENGVVFDARERFSTLAVRTGIEPATAFAATVFKTAYRANRNPHHQLHHSEVLEIWKIKDAMFMRESRPFSHIPLRTITLYLNIFL